MKMNPAIPTLICIAITIGGAAALIAQHRVPAAIGIGGALVLCSGFAVLWDMANIRWISLQRDPVAAIRAKARVDRIARSLVGAGIGYAGIVAALMLSGHVPSWVGEGAHSQPIVAAAGLLWASFCGALLAFGRR